MGKHKGLPTLHKGHQERVLSSAGCLQLLKGHVSYDLHHSLHLGHSDMQDGVKTCCIVKWQDSDHTRAVAKQPYVRLTYSQLSF